MKKDEKGLVMLKSNSVFELVDYSSEEMYYPLGIFKSLEDAKKSY